MAFTMTIHLGNAAFEAPFRGSEVARILREVADDVENGASSSDHLRDSNGHSVGEWKMV